MTVMCACFSWVWPVNGYSSSRGNNLGTFYYFCWETPVQLSTACIFFSFIFSADEENSSSGDIFLQKTFYSVSSQPTLFWKPTGVELLGLSGSETAVEQLLYHGEAGSGNHHSLINVWGWYLPFSTNLMFKAATIDYFHYRLIYPLFCWLFS